MAEAQAAVGSSYPNCDCSANRNRKQFLSPSDFEHCTASQSFYIKNSISLQRLFWSGSVSPLSFPLLCLNKDWLINQAFLCINDEDFWQVIWYCYLHAVHWNLGKANYLQITTSGARQCCRFWAGKITCKILDRCFIWINLIFFFLTEWLCDCLA